MEWINEMNCPCATSASSALGHKLTGWIPAISDILPQNNLLNNRANTGVLNTKSEDDTLLLLKADKTVLIDSYTKTETNNLLNNKTDNGVSYTKSERDAFLLLKSDKIQLTVTDSSFVQSDADDTVVFFGAVVTKPISEFIKVDYKLMNYMNTVNNQLINGIKSLNANINATGYVKTDNNETSILWAGGGDALLSSLGGLQEEETLAGVLSFENIRIPSDPTEAYDINGVVGVQFSWKL
ncbi:MAG: hypothetical protein EZS28_003184 [Streblomastix strix]|uniref:Uncharacterized protein n=1 Tax=Streblomastix strix TaxID=222440 RepID=A0A5J4X454_9EUKA|nr:MAG: hypothetical protein EZS28_003184 [Streblomastix strix]